MCACACVLVWGLCTVPEYLEALGQTVLLSLFTLFYLFLLLSMLKAEGFFTVLI